MTDTRPKIEIDQRLVNETFRSLEDALETAQRNPEGHATITMPGVVIDGLMGMVRGPDDGDFWYRRRQFIVFYGAFVARHRKKPRLDSQTISDGHTASATQDRKGMVLRDTLTSG